MAGNILATMIANELYPQYVTNFKKWPLYGWDSIMFSSTGASGDNYWITYNLLKKEYMADYQQVWY